MTDLAQIERVLADYAWACDNGEWAGLAEVFDPEAELDSSTTGGPAGGRDEVVAWLEESLSQVAMIQHVVSNLQIDVGGDGVLPTGGYHQLRFARTGDRWRIRRLHEDNRWMQHVGAARAGEAE
jgi:hypothetical protein